MARRSAALGSLLCFSLTCILALAGERHLLENLDGFALEEEGPPAIKAAHLRQHGDEISLLFLGSSRVYRHLNPAVFDARMAELGRATTSYNYGLPGVRFYELLYLAERLLAAPPPALRWVVLELGDPEPPLEDANLKSRRSLEWHTAELTWMAAITTLESARPRGQRWHDVRAHLEAFCLRSASAGLGVPALVSRFEPVVTPADTTPAGFLPLDHDPGPATQERRREFLAALAANPRLLRERVRAIRPGRGRGAEGQEAGGAEAEDQAPPELPARVAEVVGRLVTRFHAAGIEPLFFLSPPAERDNRDWVQARERGLLPNLFAYDDPREHPEFYLELETRFDLNHLYKSAGNRLTRLLADDVAQHLARQEGR